MDKFCGILVSGNGGDSVYYGIFSCCLMVSTMFVFQFSFRCSHNAAIVAKEKRKQSRKERMAKINQNKVIP